MSEYRASGGNRNPRDIRAVARRQHGVFSLDQAMEGGYSKDAVTRRARNGTFERVFPRTYRLAGAPVSVEQWAMAATLWAGPGAVASHRTAAHLWGLVDGPAFPLHVVTPRQLTRPPGGVTTHTEALAKSDTGMLRGVPVTSPTRTLLDLAGETSADLLLPVVDVAVTGGLVTAAALRGAIARSPGRRGVARLRRVLDSGTVEGGWASALERAVEDLLRGARLPPHEREHAVGRYRLDFAWPSRRVGVEADGRRWHSTVDDFQRDRAKHNQLTAAGWRILRVTWDDLAVPEPVIARLGALLET